MFHLSNILSFNMKEFFSSFCFCFPFLKDLISIIISKTNFTHLYLSTSPLSYIIIFILTLHYTLLIFYKFLWNHYIKNIFKNFRLMNNRKYLQSNFFFKFQVYPLFLHKFGETLKKLLKLWKTNGFISISVKTSENILHIDRCWEWCTCHLR